MSTFIDRAAVSGNLQADLSYRAATAFRAGQAVGGIYSWHNVGVDLIDRQRMWNEAQEWKSENPDPVEMGQEFNPREILTQERFRERFGIVKEDGTYADNPLFPFMPNESVEMADLRINTLTRRAANEGILSKINGTTYLASIGGSMVGSMIHGGPDGGWNWTDMGLSVLPGLGVYGVGAIARAAHVASTTSRIYRSLEAIRKSRGAVALGTAMTRAGFAPLPATFNAVAAGRPLQAAAWSSFDLTRMSVQQQIYYSGVLYAGANHVGYDYTLLDVGADIGIGGLFSGVIGSPSIFANYRMANTLRLSSDALYTLDAAVSSGNMHEVWQQLDRTGASIVTNYLEKNPEIRKIMAKPIGEITPVDQYQLARALDGWTKSYARYRLAQAIEIDGNTSINNVKTETNLTYGRMTQFFDQITEGQFHPVEAATLSEMSATGRPTAKAKQIWQSINERAVAERGEGMTIADLRVFGRMLAAVDETPIGTAADGSPVTAWDLIEGSHFRRHKDAMIDAVHSVAQSERTFIMDSLDERINNTPIFALYQEMVDTVPKEIRPTSTEQTRTQAALEWASSQDKPVKILGISDPSGDFNARFFYDASVSKRTESMAIRPGDGTKDSVIYIAAPMDEARQIAYLGANDEIYFGTGPDSQNLFNNIPRLLDDGNHLITNTQAVAEANKEMAFFRKETKSPRGPFGKYKIPLSGEAAIIYKLNRLGARPTEIKVPNPDPAYPRGVLTFTVWSKPRPAKKAQGNYSLDVSAETDYVISYHRGSFASAFNSSHARFADGQSINEVFHLDVMGRRDAFERFVANEGYVPKTFKKISAKRKAEILARPKPKPKTRKEIAQIILQHRRDGTYPTKPEQAKTRDELFKEFLRQGGKFARADGPLVHPQHTNRGGELNALWDAYVDLYIRWFEENNNWFELMRAAFIDNGKTIKDVNQFNMSYKKAAFRDKDGNLRFREEALGKTLWSQAQAVVEAVVELHNRKVGALEMEVTFTTSNVRGYSARTRKNASADATIAIAEDFNTAVERLTKRSVLEQKKKYIPIDANNLVVAPERVQRIADELKAVNAKSLNIVGSDIYAIKGRWLQQRDIDDFTYALIKQVHEIHPIESIRTGGQTGFEEAGAKAGMRLNIPIEIHAPKDWAFREIDGKVVRNEQAFKARFLEPAPTDYYSKKQAADAKKQAADAKKKAVDATFTASNVRGYSARTRKNASADATIAIAVNFNTAGERLTKRSVLEQKKKYIPIDANNLEVTPERVQGIADKLKEVNAKSLNIAGNGIYTMKGKYTQQQIDAFTYALIKQVHEIHPIESIRTGGQTGFDEAGAKAGMRLGIPTEIHAPKDWTFRDIDGKDIRNEQAFKARFTKPAPIDYSSKMRAVDISNLPNVNWESYIGAMSDLVRAEIGRFDPTKNEPTMLFGMGQNLAVAAVVDKLAQGYVLARNQPFSAAEMKFLESKLGRVITLYVKGKEGEVFMVAQPDQKMLLEGQYVTNFFGSLYQGLRMDAVTVPAALPIKGRALTGSARPSAAVIAANKGGSQLGRMGTAWHEFVHVLQLAMPEQYAVLQKMVMEDPLLVELAYSAMNVDMRAYGKHYGTRIPNELVPNVVQYASTLIVPDVNGKAHMPFWRALQKRDKGLFQMMKDFFIQMIETAKTFLWNQKPDARMTEQQITTVRQIGEFFADLEFIEIAGNTHDPVLRDARAFVEMIDTQKTGGTQAVAWTTIKRKINQTDHPFLWSLMESFVSDPNTSSELRQALGYAPLTKSQQVKQAAMKAKQESIRRQKEAKERQKAPRNYDSVEFPEGVDSRTVQQVQKDTLMSQFGNDPLFVENQAILQVLLDYDLFDKFRRNLNAQRRQEGVSAGPYSMRETVDMLFREIREGDAGWLGSNIALVEGIAKVAHSAFYAFKKAHDAPQTVADVVWSLDPELRNIEAQRINGVHTKEHSDNMIRMWFTKKLGAILRQEHAVYKNVTELNKIKEGPDRNNAALGSMDGNYRRVNNRHARQRGTLQSRRDLAATEALAHLNQVLARHDGAMEIMVGANKFNYWDSWSLGRLDPDKPFHAMLAAQFREADNITRLSNLYMKDVMAYIASDRAIVPDYWKQSPMFQEVADAIRDTRLRSRDALVELGASPGRLSNHTGISQRWNNETIKKMSRAQFVAELLPLVDWEATADMHGRVLFAQTEDPAGNTVIEARPFDREQYLRQWHDNVLTGKEEVDVMNIDGAFAKSRKVVLRDLDVEVDALLRFSGHEHLGRLFTDQIRYEAEMRAVSEIYGPDPRAAVDRIIAEAKITEPLKDTIKAAEVVVSPAARMRAMIEIAVNHLDNPVNVSIATWSRRLRQVSHLINLPMAGVSVLSDIGTAGAELVIGGVKVKDLDTRYWKVFTEHVGKQFGDDFDATQQYLLGEGAGALALINANARRMGLDDKITTDGFLGKAVEWMFGANFMNTMVNAHQFATADIATQWLAMNVKRGKLDKSLAWRLKEFGIGEDAMLALKDAIVTVDGVERLGAEAVQLIDPQTARKLREYLSYMIRRAASEPDLGAQAMARGGWRDGTWEGAAMRQLTMYSTFPMTITRRTQRALFNGRAPGTATAVMMGNLVAMVGTMLFWGYIASVLRDLANLREPMFLHNMTVNGMKRVVATSGCMGVLEYAWRSLESGPETTLAPTVRTLGSAAGSAAQLDFSKAFHQMRPFYGKNLPVLGPLIQQSFGLTFGEAVGLNAHIANERNFWRNDFNQSPLLPNP